MNGYERRTKAKKEAVVSAARELFTARGIKDVGVGEIAAKAGVSQVTIYHYFNDKNALVKEILQFYLDKAIREYEDILVRDVPFPQKLKAALEREHDDEAEAARSHFSEYAWGDKALQEAFEEAAAEKSACLYRKFIGLGKKEGFIDVDIPDDAILAILFALIPVFHLPDSRKANGEYRKGVAKLLLYGLLGKETD